MNWAPGLRKISGGRDEIYKGMFLQAVGVDHRL
jgi:hypothetical protein